MEIGCKNKGFLNDYSILVVLLSVEKDNWYEKSFGMQRWYQWNNKKKQVYRNLQQESFDLKVLKSWNRKLAGYFLDHATQNHQSSRFGT